MQKNTINPWKWQDNLGFSQAIEVKQNTGTLYCSGQAAMTAEGQPVNGSMAEQIQLSLDNLETLIIQSGYQPSNIVNLKHYTTSIPDFFCCLRYTGRLDEQTQHRTFQYVGRNIGIGLPRTEN